jgi:hypothetical protein
LGIWNLNREGGPANKEHESGRGLGNKEFKFGRECGNTEFE